MTIESTIADYLVSTDAEPPRSPTPCEECAAAFPQLAEVFDEREAIGIERYGVPLDPLDDERDWEPEASEEVADAMVYVTAAIRVLEAKECPTEATTRRWLVLKEVRRNLGRALMDLRDEF